ncbi:glycosyltransferase family 2 protein [Parablautia sp. Marseille-Q6255]|uniref:glycosyltransferase family 2 protein n=1 Tax=Parablautia sp. Marseille-Q6255 TaxID=3039593 RepID=UPI0024BCA017|nr:glycosyltransferase family 2 protein [Parablautia sp. Marseille-Q6255]
MDVKKVVKSLNVYTVKKGLAYLRQYGLKEFQVRLSERFEEVETDYADWCKKDVLTPQERALQTEKEWENPPLISVVVPVFATPEQFLREMIESVTAQTYPHWELCIADGSPDVSVTQSVIGEYLSDRRIRYKRLEKNLGISGNTNEAFAMAKGEYIALFDHDDLLCENALFEVALAAREQDADVIYTDEDKIKGASKERYQPNFKPDFNLDLLRANNYICHLLVVRRALLAEVGGLRQEYDGAQDHDFILRCTELTQRIAHVPKVLYHWRVHEASTADNPLSKAYAFDAGKRAVADHIRRCGEEAEVTDTKFPGFYRVKYRVEGEPLVSILIPNKDERDTLRACLTSIKEKSTYRNYEIIIIENNSTEKETFDYYKEIDGKDRVRVVYWKEGFNYSALNNFGSTFAGGEYLLCLNNDITVITPDWLERMIGQCQRRKVGIVGARLYYPDNTIQHAGVIVGIGGVAGALFVGMPRERSGYLRKAILQQDLSAVTAACMMVDRRAWEAVGGFDEKLAVAFNDIDFCLRVREQGYLVVYEPNVELYHYESKSRGYEDTPEKQQRFQSEINFMQERWKQFLQEGDPYYNPNFSLKTCDYSLKKR